MAITLGRNIASLQTQRRLFEADQKLGSVFERLSSGQRINRASDDPAGLSVSMKLDTDSRVLNRGRANLNDGISALNLMDGYLSEVTGLVTRQQELAQQAANGSLSSEQRASLNAEYAELDKEIRRVASTAEFNGINLLQSGEFSQSEELVLDGTPTFGTLIFGTSSTDLRYVEVVAGGVLATSINVSDTETGERFNFDIAALDPEVGTIVNADILAITQDGIAIVEGATSGVTNIYSVNLATEEVTRLTDGQDVDVINVAGTGLSADESTFVFTSQTTYENGSSATSSSGSGSYRLYALDLNTGVIKTNGEDLPGFAQNLVVSADGSQVAYQTTGGLSYVDFSGSQPTASVDYETLIGVTITDLTLVGIRDNGELIGYSVDDLASNGSAGYEYFSVDSSTGAAAQLTNFGLGGKIDESRLSDDGTIIAIRTSEDLTGENPDGVDQAFRFYLSTGELIQVTNYDSGSSGYLIRMMSGDASRLVTEDTVLEDAMLATITEDEVTLNLEAGTGATGNIAVAIDSLRDTVASLGTNVLNSQSSALRAIEDADTAIDALSDLRGRIGAGLSRLDTAERVAGSQATELETASARIVDADIAAEAAELTRLNILRNASTAVLAQANQQAELSLVLLDQQSSFALGGDS